MSGLLLSQMSTRLSGAEVRSPPPSSQSIWVHKSPPDSTDTVPPSIVRSRTSAFRLPATSIRPPWATVSPPLKPTPPPFAICRGLVRVTATSTSTLTFSGTLMAETLSSASWRSSSSPFSRESAFMEK